MSTTLSDALSMKMNAARDSFLAGDHESARRLAAHVLQANPDYTPAIKLIGVLEYQKRHPDRAVRILSKAVCLDPRDVNCRHYLGMSYLELGDSCSAIRALETATRMNPSDGTLWMDLSRAYHRGGHPDKALRAIEKVLNIDPLSHEAHLQKCRLVQQTGDRQKATGLYREVIRMHPDDPTASVELAKLMQDDSFHEKAVSVLRISVDQHPQNVELRLLLSISLEAVGNVDEALNHLKTAHRCDVTNAVILNNIGSLYRKKKAFDHSVKAFEKAIALDPEFAEAYNNLAIVYRESGDIKRAAAACRKALSIRPDFAEALNHSGIIFQRLRKPEDAATYYRKAIEIKSDFAEAHYNLGNLLKEQGQVEEAIEAYQKAVECKPDIYQALNSLGSLYMLRGETANALSAYEKAIAIKPDLAQAYRHIAVLRRFKKKDRFVRGMQTLLDNPGMSIHQRIHLNFALSKAHEDLQQYDKAFQYMSEGNRLKRGTFDYDAQSNADLFAAIKKVFSKRFVTERYGSGFIDDTPIFVLGMPRSGTSLVEQILSSHPDVYGAGELSDLDVVLSSEGRALGQVKFPCFVNQLDPAGFNRLGRAYVRKIRKLDTCARFVTDKMPQNFLFAGMIKLILPNAKIVHCLRNPMDTCLSIYKNNFSRLHKYAYNLDEIGHYYSLYWDLMRHWNDVFPGYLFNVEYEKLVSDPESQVRALLTFCDLNWMDRCMAFHYSKRPVFTASTAQVRRPFYCDSVNLWKRYARHLESLVEKFDMG